MKQTLAALVLAFSTQLAFAAEPSDASIERLLTLTKAEAMMDSVYANLEQNMRQSMTAAAAGKPLSEEQRRVLDSAPRKFAEVMRQELNWSQLKPMYIQIYKESFDQDDIDGLNDFYASKAGQAYVNKMPIAMQRSMAVVQQRMLPLVGKMAEAMKAAAAEAKLGN